MALMAHRSVGGAKASAKKNAAPARVGGKPRAAVVVARRPSAARPSAASRPIGLNVRAVLTPERASQVR